nr:MAG TPA: hypothetical protein [Caudoviricetes sp.]DAV71299.1 MAG TPA: hypothetical protein [Caudoviricetes sp.]
MARSVGINVFLLNSIYSKSSTVQPPAYIVRFYRRTT